MHLLVMAISITLVLPVASSPCSALDRNSGDYWVYSMTFVVPQVQVSANGILRYEVVSQESLVLDGVSWPVNVMRATGAVSGSVELIELAVEVVVEGYVYESIDDMSTVKSDLTYWSNITWGSGSFSWPINTASRTVTIYDPPLLHGFDPSSTGPASTWTETIETRTSDINVTTGAVISETTDQIEIGYAVSPEPETVITGAGRFDTLRITATDDDGVRAVYWWSSEVGLFVKEESFIQGMSQPVQTLTLEDYSGAQRTNLLLLVAIGGIAMAAALVLLVLVMVKRRPPRPSPRSPPIELLPPPP